jgi:hypothetical protein
MQQIHILEMKKDYTAQVTHQEWIKTVPNNTILCYIDRSRLDNGQVEVDLHIAKLIRKKP